MEVDSMMMTLVIIAAAFLVSLPVLYRVLFASAAGNKTGRKVLPPGSFGLPIVGHNLTFLSTLRANTAEDWLQRRVAAYGPVSRLSLFGHRTAFLAGPSANKFIFTSPVLATTYTEGFSRLFGRRTIRHMVGDEHTRVRAMMVSFLRLDALKRYVSTMDAEVRHHLDEHWHGRASVAVMPSMKMLTFDSMSAILFRMVGRDEAIRRELSVELQQLMKGIWAVPLNLPFTRFSRCLAASRRARRIITGVIVDRRAKLERGESTPADDVITHMLSKGLPDEEITDNVMMLMVGAHDTTSALITFLLRHLDTNEDVYAKVLQEQQEIARCKVPGEEALSWDDLCKMRYTWAVALETLRVVPTGFSKLRKTLQDIEYGGYVIPKGWHVMVATHMTHSNPTIFPDPHRFDPARFEEPSSIPRYSFAPFGGGARICPGNEFAKMETLVVVHHIVTRFRWKLAAGCDGSFSRWPVPYPSKGLLIDIEPIDQGNLSQ